MADQVNPTGSLAPGLPLALLSATQTRQAQGKARAAKPVEADAKRADAAGAEAPSGSLDAASKVFKEYLELAQSDLMFQVDQDSGRIYFKILDAATKEVIRQVPSEEILAMARKLRELADPKGAKGVLVDEEG